ncbi:MAG: MBL fold metallo-hydrolase [Candidatus Dormibacteraceae bacterium]
MAEVVRVLAPNAGPYTGPGTNTWILGAGPVAIVIDPGPDDDGHLDRIDRRLRGLPVGVVLVTHSHPDHLPLAARLAARHRCPVSRHPELADQDTVRVGSVSLVALHTPGHAPDHLCFWLEQDRVAFTGDLLLGQGSTMITFPDGDMAAYLDSLDRLAALNPRMLFPGHWDPVTDAAARIADQRAHRLAREAQILAELAREPAGARLLTERVYGEEIGPELMGAAQMTLRAHLRKLVAEGRARSDADTFWPAG